MSHEHDDLFGKLCVEQGYLTPEKLEEARAAQRTAEEQLGMSLTLADAIVSKKLLTAEERDEVMRLLRIRTGEARTVGGYEVLAKAGEGGMGVVYKARSKTTGEVVALKVLPPSLARSPSLLKRFQREADIARSLRHENIVRFVEFGLDREKKLYFCALEFVEGEDLAQRVRREGSIPEGQALSVAHGIALALGHASSKGLVHRDVKPQNVMITPGGTAKLLDLGLARSVAGDDTRMTQAGMFVGSPHYASPEQAEGRRELDVRSDIYSLGATLYHALTGQVPFPGSTAAAVLTQVVSGKLAWPAEANPDLSEGVCRVIEKMMARDPADRYADPAELVRDIDVLAAGGEAPAEPVARGRSAVSRPRRARRAAASGGAAGPVGRSSGQRRVSRERPPAPVEGTGGRAAAYVVVGAGIAAGALAALYMAFGRAGKETGRPGRPSVASRSETSRPAASHAGARPKPEAPARAGSDRERQLADMFEVASRYHAEHPRQFERAATYFEKARDAAAGTRYELMADSRARDIRKAWKEAAIEALEKAKPEAAALVRAGDFDGALAKLGEVPGHLAPEVVAETRVESEKVKGEADRQVAEAVAAVVERLAAGDAEGASSALARFDRIRFAEGRAKADASVGSLRARVLAAKETREVAAAEEARGRLAGLLDEFEKLVDARDYAGARKAMLLAAVEDGLEPIAATLVAAERVAAALEARRAAVVAGVRALAGKKATFLTSKGPRRGEVERVDEAGIHMLSRFRIGTRTGTKPFTVAWADLTPEEEAKLAAGWTPAGPEGGIARALLALRRKDCDGAGAALASVGDHPPVRPLSDRVRRKIDEARLGELEAAAAVAWSGIERRASRRKPSAKEAKAILEAIAAFEKDYGETKFARSAAKHIAAAKARLAALAVAAVWHSYNVATSDGMPQAVVLDEAKALRAQLEFYESTADGAVDQGQLFGAFNAGKHRDPACLVERYWAGEKGSIPYAGKSTVGRGAGAGEAGAPGPLGVRDIQVHTPWNRHLVVAAFIAPADGSYSVTNLAVRRILPGPRGGAGNTVRYRVFDAAQNPVAELRASGDRWVASPETFQVGTMNAGDRIYFAVDPDGVNHSDVTQVAWTVTLRSGAAAKPPRTAGTLDGILVTKGKADDWIEVKADGEKLTRRYVPLEDARGRPDAKVVAKVNKLFSPNRVRLAWQVVRGRRRIVAVETLVPKEKSGVVTGMVTDKGKGWIEVTPDGGVPDRYMPEWRGGMPAAGGGPDKLILRALAPLNVGDRVTLRWMWETRRRVVKVERLGGPAQAGPVITPGIKFQDTFERSTSGWFVAPWGAIALGELTRVWKTRNPREGKALALSYTLEKGKVPIAMRLASDVNRLSFWIKVLKLPAVVIVVVNEKDESSYNSVHQLGPRDNWKRLDLDLALFTLGDDSTDENGILDFDQIANIAVADLAAESGRKGDNVILIDDVVGEYRPLQMPPPSGGDVF